MYQIIKDGNLLSTVGKPTWVRQQDNGSYGLTDEAEAQGIALDGQVYHVAGHPEMEGKDTVVVQEIDDGKFADSLTLLVVNPTDLKTAEQFRKVVQLFAGSLDDEAAMEVATIYPAYEVGRAYKEGEYLTFGVNAVGDPQLYKVAQSHSSQEDWKPDQTPALYVPIGLTKQGYPVWSQPTGAHDAYNNGDIVDFNGTLYRSKIDGNIWSPTDYPAGWEVHNE